MMFGIDVFRTDTKKKKAFFTRRWVLVIIVSCRLRTRQTKLTTEVVASLRAGVRFDDYDLFDSFRWELWDLRAHIARFQIIMKYLDIYPADSTRTSTHASTDFLARPNLAGHQKNNDPSASPGPCALYRTGTYRIELLLSSRCWIPVPTVPVRTVWLTIYNVGLIVFCSISNIRHRL